jgi:hypothetical protein
MTARSIPGLNKPLYIELRNLGIAVTLRQESQKHQSVTFWASQSEILKILHKSRIINSLQLRFGSKFYAVHKSDFYKNLRKLNWHIFFPTSTSTETPNYSEYFLPYPKCSSFSSEMYHTTMVEQMLQGFIQKMPAKRQLADIKRKIPDFTSKVTKMLKSNTSSHGPDNEMILVDRKGNFTEPKNFVFENLKELPSIELDIKFNQCQAYLNFNNGK